MTFRKVRERGGGGAEGGGDRELSRSIPRETERVGGREGEWREGGKMREREDRERGKTDGGGGGGGGGREKHRERQRENE